MIHVPFLEPDDPLWVRWKARAEAAQQAHAPGAEPDGKVYRAVKRWLLLAYARKCAYCERAIRGHAVRLDHFRPKRGIRRKDGAPVSLRAQPEPHPGYHFLVYDWRNLLPTCEQCNLAKSNRFHTANEFWAEAHQETAQEAPLLLHPSVENPSGLLRFERDGFVYPGQPGDARARYVIDTLDLNREELREDRAEAWLSAEDEMEALLLRVVRRDRRELFELTVTRLEAIRDGRAEFSAVKRLAILPGQRELAEQLEEQRRREHRAMGLTPRPQPPA